MYRLLTWQKEITFLFFKSPSRKVVILLLPCSVYFGTPLPSPRDCTGGRKLARTVGYKNLLAKEFHWRAFCAWAHRSNAWNNLLTIRYITLLNDLQHAVTAYLQKKKLKRVFIGEREFLERSII